MCVCLPLDVLSQVAGQDSRGGEEAGLWKGNEQLARLTRRNRNRQRDKHFNPQEPQEKKTAELFMTV